MRAAAVRIVDTALSEVKVITPTRHEDDRGFFSEVYNLQVLADSGIDEVFVQDNHSLSTHAGTVRGLHFQVAPHPVAKLVRVTRGTVLDVAVDIRYGSPSFGRHVAVELSADNWNQLYVPIGFAHGFCTLEPNTEVSYKVTDYWQPGVDGGILWNDPALGIVWPVSDEKAELSEKDRSQPLLEELAPEFSYVAVDR